LEADLPAITAIYGHHVQHGKGSFELDPPELPQMQRRRTEVLAQGLPHLVASRGAEVLGFAYAGAFRPRLPFVSWPKTRFTSTLTIRAKAWGAPC